MAQGGSQLIRPRAYNDCSSIQTMLKKVSSWKQTPSPVVVNKGKHGYNCWVYVSTIQKNQNTYHKYKVAHKFSKKFVSKEDALMHGWAKINGHNVTTYDVPMRHKPVTV